MIEKRKGQLKISFGMIFSIILIVVFLAFAFYAIKTFIEFQDNAKTEVFLDDLQKDVNRIWRSFESSESREYFVSSKVDFVCFIDFDSNAKGENSVFYSELERAHYSGENLAFYPVKFTGSESAQIMNLDIEKTTLEENPLCIEANGGKISLILNKDQGTLVSVEKI